MRVLLVNSFYYRRGGAEVHVLELESLLRRGGHDVAIYAMHHPENLPSPWSRYWASHIEYRGRMAPAGMIRGFVRSIDSPEARSGIRAIVRDFRPDVAHLHAVHHHLSLSVIEELKELGIPVLWTLHDYRTVCPATHLLRNDAPCERCAGGRFARALTGRCKSGSLARTAAAVLESYRSRRKGLHAKVDCTIAPSEFLAAKVTAMGLPARRIEVLPNFIEVDGPDSAPPRRSGLLYAGRLSREKGIDTLLRACAGLDGVSLRLIGVGPAEDELAQLAARLGVNATFLGWRDREDVLAAMAEAVLLVFPSTAYENCPITILEAATRMLPVVASDVGGVPEMLDRGRCGWLVPPGDVGAWRETIASALRDPEGGSSRARAARERIRERHGVETFLRRLESLYASVP